MQKTKRGVEKSNTFRIFATRFCERVTQAEVTQLVESQPSKLLVAGSSPVFRSKEKCVNLHFMRTVRLTQNFSQNQRLKKQNNIFKAKHFKETLQDYEVRKEAHKDAREEER